MITVSDALEDIIKNSPFIEEALSRGLINLSAFAREVRPKLEKRLYKNIQTGAIVMALKRLSAHVSKKKVHRDIKLHITDITVRSHLVEYTYLHSRSLPDRQRKLLNELATKEDVFCSFSEGVRETTFIASASIEKLLNKLFAEETLIGKIEHISSITIRLSNETVKTPGIYYQILMMFAWENINVVEVVSTYTELTIIFGSDDVDRAFSLLKGV